MTTTISIAPPRIILFCEICGKEITKKHGRGWQDRAKDKHHFCCREHKVEFYNKTGKMEFKPFYDSPANKWIKDIYVKRGNKIKYMEVKE